MNKSIGKYHFTGFLTGIILFLFLLSGCKTTKKVATIAAGEAKAHADFFESIQQQAFNFHTLNARMQVELRVSGSELSSRIDLKIVKDSALLLSVQPLLGVEMFRVVMNPDSIIVLDRLNKRYVAENYANLINQTPITFNFYNLQALFINHIFVPGEQGLSFSQYNKFLLKQEGRMAEVKINDSMGLQYQFLADGEEKLLSTNISNKNHALQWTYSDFRLATEQAFPMMMNVTLLNEGLATGNMRINFSRIQTETPVNIDFSVPNNYNRITFAQILRSLSGNE
ncbi:DUF4292 domain-containing protein [Parabacteroides sp. OttesenSCG-928-G07]|nr:DUF4292 domain-containing protein [Parabacteroides sp. OttesenSCG-928-G07]